MQLILLRSSPTTSCPGLTRVPMVPLRRGRPGARVKPVNDDGSYPFRNPCTLSCQTGSTSVFTGRTGPLPSKMSISCVAA